MKTYALVFLGGGIGAVLRYWLSGAIPRYWGSSFPYGILTVNILGCFLIGIVMTVFENRFLINPSLRMFIAIGIIGGFTTFSTFSYETLAMLHDSEFLKAGLYVTSSVLFGLGATYIGSIIGKIF
ncbi:MAG: fluoride efflux transporter CrcB [Bacteroidetes bacterium]|nr:fluoride efflux transporter CrcB [Bacteroidota bacterium]